MWNYELEQGEYNTNGEKVSTFVWLVNKVKIPVKSNTEYTISQKERPSQYRIIYWNNDNYLSRDNNTQNTTTGYSSFTFTTPENCNEIYIQFRSTLEKIASGTYEMKPNDISNIQLEQGSTATSYVEHQEQNYPFSLKSKNLFDKTTLNVNKGLLADGTLSNNTALSVSDYIPVLANTDYFLSNVIGLNLGRTCAYYDENKAFISIQTFSGVEIVNAKITTPNNTKYMRIAIKNGNENIVQIEKGTTATDYEPYYKYELCKIDTAQDYFYKQNDKWYLHKEIGKTIFDGSESGWNIFPIGANKYQHFIAFSNVKHNTSQITIMSDYARGILIANRADEGNNNTVFTYNGGIAFRFDEFTTTNDFKTWLSTHNIEVYYQLATPTDIEITDTTLINQLEAIKQAQGYNDQTNISQTNDELPFILDIEALKGGN